MKVAAPFMDCVPVRSRLEVTDTFKARRPNDRLLAHPHAHSCHRQRATCSSEPIVNFNLCVGPELAPVFASCFLGCGAVLNVRRGQRKEPNVDGYISVKVLWCNLVHARLCCA